MPCPVVAPRRGLEARALAWSRYGAYDARSDKGRSLDLALDKGDDRTDTEWVAAKWWGREEHWRPTRAQERAVWELACKLADASAGCFVRSRDDGTDEVLMTHRGEFRRYVILRDGQTLLVECAPRTSRYRLSLGLWYGGGLCFFATGAIGNIWFAGPNGEIPGLSVLPALIAFCGAVIGCLITPRIKAPARQGWTELVFADSGG
jgi:hypothetical protein